MAECGESQKPESLAPIAVSPTGAARAIFISYASHDVGVAHILVGALERASLSCWIAPRDVVPGALYADEIVRAINECGIVVLVLSEQAIASSHVGKEIERASSKNRRIVTLRTDSASLTRPFEYFLSESQWIDVGPRGLEAAAAKLVEAVRCHLDPAAAGDALIAQSPVAIRSPTLPRRTWVLLFCLAVLLIGLIYFTADTFWRPKHRPTDRAVATMAPVGATSTVAIPEKSVAVLPFLDMSEKKDQEYFSDGLSEELINRLTKVPELRVPARTSSFFFKGKQSNIIDIAKALGVAHVLEGSVRKSGHNLRITAQLIRVDDGYHIWSETFDRKVGDIFKMQDEIAGAVVTALKVSLKGNSIPASIATHNSEAYIFYLQSVHIADAAGGKANYQKVIDYADKALAKDATFAAAWAMKSSMLSALGRRQEARESAEQALRLDPKLPDAHTVLSKVKMHDLDIGSAEAELKQALELDPENSWALASLALLKAERGDLTEAIGIVERTLATDPVNVFRYQALAWFYYAAGEYSEARSAARRGLDLSPNAPYTQAVLAMIFMAQGDAAAALVQLESISEATSALGGYRVIILDALGRTAEADAALANLEKTDADDSPYEIAQVYASRNNLDAAFKWFDRALQTHDADIFQVKVDPFLKNIRSDPRYHSLLLKLQLI